MKKFVLKLDLPDDKAKQKALKTVSTLSGIDAISMDMKEKKLTVIGTVDPVSVVSKLRKYWQADIVSVGPAKEPERKEEPKKEEVKEEEKKEEAKKEEGKKEEEKKEEPKKEEQKKEDEKKDEKKEEEKNKEQAPGPALDPFLEVYKPNYRAYTYPPMATYYYVQSMEENPNACVIC